MDHETASKLTSSPTVSVVIPCFNEESTIELLLEALRDQSYPKEQITVVIADGMSTDHTRDRIEAFSRAHPELKVKIVDNPVRHIPAGVNRAIEAAEGEFIVRLDAHSVPNRDYIRFSIDNLEGGKGQNVGGVWDVRPGSGGWEAQAIAIAAAHPLGVGDAHYRHASRAQSVDTVPFGAFARSLVDKVGLYDEGMLANEDYEFNARVRDAGGTIWLDPRIRAVYFARASLAKLCKQYWRYGFWKVRMLRRYPKTLRWRQALPPVFVLGCVTLLIASAFVPAAGWLLGAGLLFYLAVLLAGSLSASREHSFTVRLGVPIAMAAMHFSWGSAFLWSVLRK